MYDYEEIQFALLIYYMNAPHALSLVAYQPISHLDPWQLKRLIPYHGCGKIQLALPISGMNAPHARFPVAHLPNRFLVLVKRPDPPLN